MGIRAQESLNRYHAVTRGDASTTFQGVGYSTEIYPDIYNFYPLFDWSVEDVWTANGRFGFDYNKLYDMFYLAGVPLKQMRVANPFHICGVDALKLYRAIEPNTWGRLIGRVNGANFGALYGGTKAMGYKDISLPSGHTWKSYMAFLLETLPEHTATIYKKKFGTSFTYWLEKGGALPVKVIEAQLGPSIAETSPNPLTVTDFTHTQRFTVSYLDITEEWSVQIMQTSVLVTTNAADAWATRAYLHGSGQVGETFGFKLRKRSEATWITLDPASITVTGGEFSAQYTGLEPDTEYVYVAISGANQGEEVTFRTEEALPLPNGSLDQWHQNGKVWNPWPDGGTSFFDTGNRGATTVGESNTQPSDELPAGITAGKSAKLESKWIAVKFAAGNLFAGEYLRTDGTNGVLAFGRPFTSRPVKLRGKYRYEPKPITRYSTSNPDLSHLQNLPDSCHIYIALSDASQPLEIRTKLSERQTFSPSAPDILAFAELVSGSSTGGQFVDFTLELDYRATNRVPKYIMVVGSSSKYGDYFTGGEGSLLYLDQFELLYE